MIERLFLGFINENQLIGPSDRTLLAVSGGLDSMVMAHLFHQTTLSFAVAHVDFALRGAESDADADFVQNRAAAYGVPFHRIRFDTRAVAHERGLSIQMAARELRYDWFRQLLDLHGYSSVATAHHLNDVLETMLLNLTRGTGLAGLHGIASRHDRVIRPLLFATRDDLATYVQKQQISYREDSSNADDKYARNRIRHQVVPVLTGLNPGLWRTLPHTIERLGAAERLMQAELDRSWQEISDERAGHIWLPTSKLLMISDVTFRLTAWLKPYGFTADQARAMTNALTGEVGQVFQSATHRVTHDRIAHDRTPIMTGLMLEPLSVTSSSDIVLTDWPDAPVPIGNGFTLSIDRIDRPADFRPPSDPNYVCFNADALRLPLRVRQWEQGDRFRPLGLNGQKLVSNLLNDLKRSRTEREQTMVLLSGDQIAWVIGSRMAHSFRITDQTTQLVCMRRIVVKLDS